MRKVIKKPAKKSINRNNFGLYLLLGMTLLIAFLFISLLKIKNNDTADGIKMYFVPDEIVLTSGGKDRMKVKTVKIKAKAKKAGIAFARVTIVFNPRKINLASQIKTNVNLSNVIEKTSLREANASGRAVIVIAATPENNPPSGDFELATFTVKAVGNSGRETETEINLLTSDMQIVDKNVRELKISASILAIELESNDL